MTTLDDVRISDADAPVPGVSSVSVRSGRLIPTLSAAASAVALGALVFPAPFIADDFCYRDKTTRLGVVGLVRQQYNEWTGRFSFAAIEGVVMAGPRWVGSLMPLVIVLTCIASFAFLGRRALNSNGHLALVAGRELWAFSAISVALVVATSTVSVQVATWVTGSITYLLPIALAAFATALLVGTPTRAHQLGAAALFAIAAGCSESSGATIVIALVVVCWRHASSRTRLLLPLVGTAASMALVVAAPGNDVRRAEFEGKSAIVAFLQGGITGFIHLAAGVLASPIGLFATVAFGVALGLRFSSDVWALIRRWITTSLLISIASASALEIIALRATGRAVELRALLFPTFFALVFLVAACARLVAKRAEHASASTARHSLAVAVTGALTIAAVTPVALEVRVYAKQLREVQSQIVGAPNGVTIRSGIRSRFMLGGFDAPWISRCAADIEGRPDVTLVP